LRRLEEFRNRGIREGLRLWKSAALYVGGIEKRRWTPKCGGRRRKGWKLGSLETAKKYIGGENIEADLLIF
jgi:hypothetical protein